MGKNDFELFPEPLDKKFRKDDEWIIGKSKPMTGLVELFLNLQGIPAWYLTNKFPTMNKKAQPIGVMGTVQRYDKDSLRLTRDDKMESVIDQLRAEDFNAPSIKRLAGANGQTHVSNKINALGSRTRPRFGCAGRLRGYLCHHRHQDL